MSAVVEVTVAGRNYRLRSDEDGADLEAVARLVNERIGDIQKAGPHLEKEEVAILAALNVGDELLRQRAASESQSDAVETAVAAVRSRLADLVGRMEQAAPSPD